MRIANLIMCGLFTFSALLRFNDPGPVRWVAIYAVAAVTCGWLAAARRPTRAAWLVPVLVAAFAQVRA